MKNLSFDGTFGTPPPVQRTHGFKLDDCPMFKQDFDSSCPPDFSGRGNALILTRSRWDYKSKVMEISMRSQGTAALIVFRMVNSSINSRPLYSILEARVRLEIQPPSVSLAGRIQQHFTLILGKATKLDWRGHLNPNGLLTFTGR